MKKIIYSSIVGLLISSLALGANVEVRKWGLSDMQLGPSSQTWTSSSGKSVRYFPYPFAGDGTHDNAAVIDVRAYGAVGDGVTDDTAAFQLAHDALPSDGGAILVPSKSTVYVLNSTVVFTKPVLLMGLGFHGSELSTSVAGNIIITTTSKIVIDKIGFTATGSAIGNSTGIKTLSTATGHTDSIISNCYFQGFSKCYWSQRTSSIHINNNRFSQSSGVSLYLENLTDSDEGDSFITNNYFAGGTNDNSIVVLSTSGLNIYGNKFNGPVNSHISIRPTGTNNSGNNVIVGNSIEGFVTSGIELISDGSGTITRNVISGNQFSSHSATHIIVGNKGWDTVISGNTFNDTLSTSGIGIDIQTGAKNTNINGNSFHQILTAINSGSIVTGTNISGNRYALTNNAALEVTNIYLGGEDDDEVQDYGSYKEFEVDRLINNTDNVTYINAFQLKGSCILEVFLNGIVQGSGNARKYRKVLVTDDTTITDLIPLVSVGSDFDLQITGSGGFTVIGIKRNGATGTQVQMKIGIKVIGYVKDLSKV